MKSATETESAETDTVDCPHCRRATARIPTQVEKIDWASALFIGIWAVFFPSLRQTKLQCRNCGKLFSQANYKMKKGDRIAAIALTTISVTIVGAVVFLLWHAFDQ